MASQVMPSGARELPKAAVRRLFQKNFVLVDAITESIAIVAIGV